MGDLVLSMPDCPQQGPCTPGKKVVGVFLHFQKCCYWASLLWMVPCLGVPPARKLPWSGIYLAGWAPVPAFTGVSLSTGPGGTSPAAEDLGPGRACAGLGAPAGPARSFPGRLQPRPLGISRQGHAPEASESSHWPASRDPRFHWLIVPKSRPRSFRVLIGQFRSEFRPRLPRSPRPLSLPPPPRLPRFHWSIPYGLRAFIGQLRLGPAPRGFRALPGRFRSAPAASAF